jgi:hypothetical protein
MGPNGGTMKRRESMNAHGNPRRLLALAACACAALACNLALGAPAEAPTIAPSITAVLPATNPVIAASATAEGSATTGPSATAEASATPEATATSSGPLSGSVLQRSNCRYGPGAYYLSKIGMREGSPIEVLGRTVDGGWAHIQFTGTKNLCWINSKLIQVNGDLMSLPDAYQNSSSLPLASDFGPVSIVSVSGSAAVTVEWTPIILPEIAMPSEIERQYVIEVWTCLNGSPAFYTVGTDETEATFEVDNSCGVVSRADIVAQNKLGVSGITPISIP